MAVTNPMAESLHGEVSRRNAPKFSVYHKHDHNFFLLIIAVIWLGILMGFIPDVIRHMHHPQFTYPWIVFPHAVVFVGWLCLLTTQILLVRRRKISLHRKLGKIGMYWAVVLPIVGAMTVFIVDRAVLQQVAHFKPTFDSIQYGDLVLFAILTWSALALRKTPAAHKRLILIGTLCLVDAGFARWLGEDLSHLFGNSYWSVVLEEYYANILLILSIGAYDLLTRHRLHRAYAYGATVAIGGELLLTWLLMSPWWEPISFKLIGR